MKWEELIVASSNAQESAVLWKNIFIFMSIFINDNQLEKSIGIYLEKFTLFYMNYLQKLSK
jgi:hypothetical protein